MRVKIRLLKFESNFSKLLFTHEPIGDGQVRDNRRISPAIWRRLGIASPNPQGQFSEWKFRLGNQI
jgi:hypothetical protein